ncbi:probable cytochrome P450 4ad1 [Teleopsis dalmanni]|uniref:probable cytochrome P450 4ad1 n=1 Tax=Teleopsis dalmanni TaxID=139649 RepID=UPI0018CE5C92|nr:probable cytochrome P450 4ad1 [Teleopsis dalmanni]
MLGIFLFSCCVALLYWIHKYYHTFWKHLNKFPGPLAILPLGNFLQMTLSMEKNFKTILGYCRQYKYNDFRFYGGLSPYLLILKPESMEHILTNVEISSKEGTYKLLRPWLGNGIVVANGSYWHQRRKMLTPFFHFDIIKQYLPIINNVGDRFIAHLKKYSQTFEVFDMQNLGQRVTIDMLSETAMGIKLNALDSNISSICDKIHSLGELFQRRRFILLYNIPMCYEYTADYKKQQLYIKEIKVFIKNLIENRRKELLGSNNNDIKANLNDDKDKQKYKYKSLLDFMVIANKDEEVFSQQNMIDEINTFLLAGNDTTAQSMSFTLFCLSRHPHIQQAAVDEQIRIFGTDKEQQPTFQNLNDMKYLDLVIKETLRVFPTIPFVERTLIEDTILDGKFVPKGTNLVLAFVALGQNKDYFEDPMIFKPDRFDADKRKNIKNFTYIPFSAGSRNCLGQKLSTIMLKIILSKVLRSYELLPSAEGLSTGIHDLTDEKDIIDNPFDPRLQFGVSLQSSNGILLRIKERQY